MTQYHFVVYFDDRINKWKVDYDTTSGHFPDGTIWNGEEWEILAHSPNADVEEEVYGELVDILETVNTQDR